MSAQKTEKKRRTAGRKLASARAHNQSRALYVYCVGELPLLAPLFNEPLPASIEPGNPLELIESTKLAAVASSVPLEDYGEEALEAHLTEATWTAVRAMRHEKVVDHFAARASIVPLRFGTIYTKRAGVEKMLAEREDELHAAINHLRGREEWGVNIFCDRKVLMGNLDSLSPRLREMGEQAASSTPGHAFLVRKKMIALRSDEARAEIKRTVNLIERELHKESEGLERLRVLKDEGGEHGELVGKLAFLVEKKSFHVFRGAAEKLAEEYAHAGFKLELTGPWPAYNFVASRAAEDK